MYLLGLTILINSVAFLANYALSKSCFYKPSFFINHFVDDKTFDYFIIGSSRGLTTLNTKQIDDSLNTRGVNLSMDDTDIGMHALMIEHFFKSGGNAKYCILTIDVNNLEKDTQEFSDNAYRFTPMINNDYVHNYFLENEPRPRLISRAIFFPVLPYAYYNLELFYPSLIATINPEKRYRFDENGNYSYPDTKKKQSTSGSNINKDVVIKEISGNIINTITDILEAHECKLVIYIAPYEHLSLKIKNKEDYTILNHSDIVNDSFLFFDKLHVNSKGRKFVTDEFIKHFKDTVKKSSKHKY